MHVPPEMGVCSGRPLPFPEDGPREWVGAVGPTSPAGGPDGYAALLCPRVDDEYANVDCRDNKCEKCKDLRLLVGVDGKGGRLLQRNEMDALQAVKWERWTKSKNLVTGSNGWDFHTMTTSIADVIKELMPPY